MDDWRAWAEIVAGILAGDRIDRIRPELAAARGFRDGLADLQSQFDLIRADRGLHLERGHPGVLTDRSFAGGRLIDVLSDDRQSLAAACLRRFCLDGRSHCGADIWWQIGRRPSDEFDHAVEEVRKHPSSIIEAPACSGVRPHALRKEAIRSRRIWLSNRARSGRRAPG